MTLGELSLKMFKANIKRYRLFMMCNMASVAILFSFLSIYANRKFMDGKVVDSMISSNIIAPTVFLILFIAMFIPYTQNVFIKTRQKDYGILLTLGMTENEVRNSVLKENLILCLVFLLGGLMSGTVLSVFFLGFIRYGLGVSGIDITISLKAYAETAVCVAAVFVISLAVNIVGLVKSSIREKLRFTEESESGDGNLLLLIGGVVVTAISLICLTVYYRANHDVFLLCWLFCVLGSALVFFNGEVLIELIRKKHYKKYVKHIFVLSDIKYYYSKNKKIFFVNAWLFFIIFFFIAFALGSYSSMTRNASVYHPFDMAYAETESSFKPLSDAEMETIAKKNGDKIILDDSINFIRNNSFTVFRVDDVNKLLNKNYSVTPGSLLVVYGYDPNDGYDHDYHFDASNLYVKSSDGQLKFTIQDKIADPLFGQINAVSNYMLLADQADFKQLETSGGDFNIQGELHLYNFENWRDSSGTVNEVWDELLAKNHIVKQDYETNRFYQVSSRIDAYETALKSSKLLIFVFLYLSLLLYFAAIVMIHFKLQMEHETEKKKFHSLHRIGISETQVKTAVYQKILVIFSVSPLCAILLTFAFGQSIFIKYGYGIAGTWSIAAMSIVFLLAHLWVYRRYARVYYTGIVSEMYK